MMKGDRYQAFHERLIAADPVAPTQLVEAIWEPLFIEVKKRHPTLRTSDFLKDAVTDALISYIKNPAQFDPIKRGLFGFLIMAAEGDLRNALAKATRRNYREISIEDVELAGTGGKKILGPWEAPDLDTPIDAQRMGNKLSQLFKDPKDLEAVFLLMEGERRTEAFARIWGFDRLPKEDQARHVKRHKDRIKKVLDRHGEGDYGRKQ